MNYYGHVGILTEPQEVSPGVWNEGGIKEVECYGTVIKSGRQFTNNEHESTNDDIKINNTFSILADPYVYSNMGLIRYIEWQGLKWKVESVGDNYPRVEISVGGIYNGEQA